MKRTGSLFLVALLAGTLTLGAYKLLFENPSAHGISSGQELPVFQTSNLPVYPAGAAIEGVDFTLAAENTVNAVVHVKNITLSRGPSLLEFFYGYEERARPQVGTGSGVIISPDGYVVTNNHVIAQANQLMVTLNNNKTYEATVVGTDPTTDIALLKIEEEGLPYLAFGDSDQVKVGEWVLAVGNPFNLTSTVTAGIVSAKARNLGRNQSFLQTDAAVNPGNSGGALVNIRGDLVGINTAITSQTGSYIGYSFAVPSNIARKVVQDLLEYGSVIKGVLGVQTLRPDLVKERGIDAVEGVYVESVEEDSGAEQAGLRQGDIIKQVDGVKIRTFTDLTGYIASKSPGDRVEVRLERGGESVSVPVEVRERQTLQLPLLGFTVKNLSEADRKKFKTDQGVKILAVPPSSEKYGLVGKVILAVDGQAIRDVKDAGKYFGEISRYGQTSITLMDEKGEKERLIFQ
ncbi:trypsin-like peptidase domain-containing protein [Robiginitalea marina]|uniref:Trypsin-like peptidase domain-containing protein n=1 Tax=Robiginitalea marina TaxID=2954105 RepID=A0ABT1AVW8_9FLAO|nr:trypsin-like peptidase domain-containing protein [Robiginitalea marina]MCO5723757.1 trypsin-like peptidase domain-containing protein [Robiginitalea marina]